MSSFSDITIDLFKKTVVGTISSFSNYLSISNIVQVLNTIIKELECDCEDGEIVETTCRGCLEEQPNQQAHMDYGGCMSIYEEFC